jgi:hypothetical protein
MNNDTNSVIADIEAEIFRGELGLDFSPSVAELGAEIVRELDMNDLELYRSTPVGSTTPNIKNIRHTHHRLAQLLASGLKEIDCAAATGYSQSRISILKNDPAFSELLSHYSQTQQAAYQGMVEKLAAVGHDAIEELHERLIETPDTFSNNHLLDLIKATADRSDAPPKTKTENNHNFAVVDARTIKEIKDAASKRHQGTLEQITFNPGA